jgi:K+-transporting ATPase ATPase C chain
MKQILCGIRVLLALTLLTGLLYPGIVTGLCQLLFPQQANGSLIERNGRLIGSALIGQNFNQPGYFHPRPSSAGSQRPAGSLGPAGPQEYDASASSGSNLGPTSRKLVNRVEMEIAAIRKENPAYSGSIPSDMVTASGSGLDPHISPATALVQAARVAQARHTTRKQVEQFIQRFVEDPDLGLLGEPRVSVLQMNLALDREFPI